MVWGGRLETSTWKRLGCSPKGWGHVVQHRVLRPARLVLDEAVINNTYPECIMFLLLAQSE